MVSWSLRFYLLVQLSLVELFPIPGTTCGGGVTWIPWTMLGKEWLLKVKWKTVTWGMRCFASCGHLCPLSVTHYLIFQDQMFGRHSHLPLSHTLRELSWMEVHSRIILWMVAHSTAGMGQSELHLTLVNWQEREVENLQEWTKARVGELFTICNLIKYGIFEDY